METKNNCVKKILFSLFVILLPMLASAERVEIDGIWYNLVLNSQQAEVIYKGSSYDEYSDEYSGAITIPSMVTCGGVKYTVTSIGYGAFYGCSRLTSITIPDGVTKIGDDAFNGCSSLTSIIIPDGVTRIGGFVFDGCSSLTSITLPDGVTSIGQCAFKDCSFSSIILPDGLKSIDNFVFAGCSSLTSITIPASVTSIGDWAFNGCSSLTAITIPKNSQLTGISDCTFRDCNSLTSITIPESVTSIGMMAFKGCVTLTTITIPENSQLKSIGEQAFSSCSNLTSITIPASVTSIGTWAFNDCSSLTAITIPESVTSIGSGAFCSCGFTSITIPDGVTSIEDETFRHCSSLTSITLPDGVTSIGEDAFLGCSSLTAISLPEGLKSIGEGAFRDCSSLTAVTIPESVTSVGSLAFFNSGLTIITIPEGLTRIADGTFAECRSLTSITIPENSQLTSIGDDAFFRCSNLTTIPLSEGVDSIGKRAFYGCSSLTSITLPNGVTSIEDETFYSCSSLTAITIPENVTSIGNYAFSSCSSLYNVYCYAGKVPSTGTDTFVGWYIRKVTLHVPVSALNDYKATTPWSGFGEIVGLVMTITEITLDRTSATLTEGDTLTLNATVMPNYADKTSVTWSSSNEEVAIVDGRGNIVAMRAGTAIITVTANDSCAASASCEVTVNYANYVITYLVDGEVYATDTLSRTSPITPLAEPTREGYTFSGWSEIPETVPAHDVIIRGMFIANSYKITYMLDGEVYYTDSVAYNAKIPTIEIPTKEGYTFDGWKEIPNAMPANDLVIEGSFSINSYTITYMIDGRVYKIVTYKFGDLIIPLDVPQETGFIFSGWAELPETMPAENIIIVGVYVGIDGSYSDGQGVKYSLQGNKDGYTVTGISANPSSDIVIPAEVKDLPVTAIGERAFIAAKNLRSVVIPSNITVVGEDAFYSCKDLLVVEWNTAAPVRAECFDKAEKHGNMLVFVSDANTKVSYKGNVIVEGVAEQITISDDMAFRSPQQFTAHNITFTKNFDKKTKIGVSGGWEAMVLPFDVQSIVSKEKGELKLFGEADFTTSLPYWLGELQADGTFATTQNITANKPFIMQLPNSDEYRDIYNVEGEVTFSATDVTVLPTTDMEQEVGNGYVMLGSYEGTTADSHVYALNDEEYTADGETYMAGSIFVANARDIRPFEAYVYTTNASRAPYLRVGNAGETGIGHSTFNVQHSTKIYDLTGRKVLNTENLKGGIYIVNGKKVVID